MKNLRTLLLLLAAIIAVSCSNSTETKAQNDQAVATESHDGEEGKTIHLNKAMFIEKVMDFLASKDITVSVQ